MSPRIAARALAFPLVLSTLLAGCSGDSEGGEDTGTQPSALPAPLSPTWTRPVPGAEPGSPVTLHRAGNRIGYAAGGVLAAWDARTGAVDWRYETQHACSVGEPNAAGDFAMTVGPQCRDVAVIDGDTGEERWRTHVPTISPGYDSGDVVASIGDRTVTVVQFCGQVTRLSLQDGRRLGILAPHDRACANEADSDGQLIAIWHDPETAATPDDHGTGWIPSWDGEAAFELYDADTGKLLWRRTTDRRGGGLYPGAVVSSDPVILTLQDHGHTTMRRYRTSDPTPGPYVGRQLARNDGEFTPIGIADNVMVGTYGSAFASTAASRIFAYDLTTGEELWSRENPQSTTITSTPGSVVAGVDAQGVVLTQQFYDADAPVETRNQTWVTRWNLRTGADAGVIGWINNGESAAATWAVVDNLLLSASNPVRAFALPDPDPELSAPSDGEAELIEGDIRPDPMADPCTAVRPATLKLLGLRHSTALPVPADCSWVEASEPQYSERALHVAVTVAQPGQQVTDSGESRQATAVESAKAVVRSALQDYDSEYVTGLLLRAGVPEPRPLDGLGDEAYTASQTGFAGSIGSATGAYLLVRVRNVVVEIQAEGGYDLAYRHSAAPSLARSEAGVVAAARDVLESFGLTLGSLPSATPGRYDELGDVCGVLREDAAALGLPQPHAVMPPGFDQRAAECAWWRNEGGNAELHVHAYAAAGSPLSGRSASQVALSVYDSAQLRGAKPTRGLADRATIDRYHYASKSGDYVSDSFTVTALADNLVVQVEYERDDHTDPDVIKADALQMTRKVLRSIRR